MCVFKTLSNKPNQIFGAVFIVYCKSQNSVHMHFVLKTSSSNRTSITASGLAVTLLQQDKLPRHSSKVPSLILSFWLLSVWGIACSP